MKVKQLVTQLNEDTFADDYFRACGIEDVEEFKNPMGKYVGDIREYSAIERKVKVFKEYLDKISRHPFKIAIIQDCDLDGICSASLTYFMLIRFGVYPEQIVVLYHTDKSHGLTNEIMKQLTDPLIRMVIIPDAGSNDVNQIQYLMYHEMQMVIVLDHHEIDKINIAKLDTLQRRPNFILVNNQLENRTNKSLCGTGVVFKFFQALELAVASDDKQTFTKYIDIVALANIADVMDMRNLENIIFNRWGLWRDVKNPFLKELCIKYCSKYDHISPEDIAWNIAPKLNAVCRSDDQETKAMVFEAFCEIRNDYDDVIKAIERCYRYQRETCKKMYEKLISESNLENNYGKVVIIFCDNTPYTGLIANKLMEHYNKPILLVHEDDGLCIGSCRSPIPIREKIASFPNIVFAQGHEHAFGVCWKKSDTRILVDYLESLELDYDQEITVASILDPSHIPTWLFRVTEEYTRCWGTGVESPKFCIPRIRINAKDIKALGNGNTLKFTYKDVDYLKFFALNNDKERLEIGKNKPLIIDLIGSLGVNLYQGKERLQVKIDKFEIVEERWEDIW